MGNRVEIVGKVTTHNDVYQISDLTMSKFEYNPEKDSKLLEAGTSAPPAQAIEAKDLNSKITLTFEGEEEDEELTLDYGAAIMSTLVSLSHLQVTDVYTTKDGTTKGAVSITCKAEDDTVITVRTDVLRNADGSVVTEDIYVGKTICVTGLVDLYDGKYQVRVSNINNITFE